MHLIVTKAQLSSKAFCEFKNSLSELFVFSCCVNKFSQILFSIRQMSPAVHNTVLLIFLPLKKFVRKFLFLPLKNMQN